MALLSAGLSYLAFSSAPNIVGLFHDDGIYAVVAKALSEGQGYRIVSVPGEPYQTKYPFLYSYLLSWVWSLGPDFPDNIPLLHLVLALSLFHRPGNRARPRKKMAGTLNIFQLEVIPK